MRKKADVLSFKCRMPMAMHKVSKAAQVKMVDNKITRGKTEHDQPWQDGHGWPSSYKAIPKKAYITSLQASNIASGDGNQQERLC